MTTLYPAALDNFSNPTPSTSQAATRTHSEQHSDLNDAVEAIQATVGISVAETGEVARSMQAAMRDMVSVKAFGALGDGAANDAAAFGLAMATGKPVYVPQGTYLISTMLDVPAGAKGLYGLGGSSIIKRTNASTAAALLRISVEDFVLDGITIDGNKALNANGCNGCNVVNVERVTIRNNRFINNKTASGNGAGLTVNGIPLSADSKYVIENNEADDNDASGISVVEAGSGSISFNRCNNNGSNGLDINNFDTSHAQLIRMMAVHGNRCRGNTGSGIVIGNFLQDNVQGGGDYGFSNPEAKSMAVSDNVVCENGVYGLSLNGYFISATGNVAEGNSTSAVSYAGIYYSGLNGVVSGNVSANNLGRGIECGGARNSVISNNVVKNNPTVGMSMGCAQRVLVIGNYFEGNGDTAGSQVLIDKYDGATVLLGFDFVALEVNVVNNTFVLTGSQYGVNLRDGVADCSVVGNNFAGGSVANYIRNFGSNTLIDRNVVPSTVSNSLTVDVNNRLTVPDVFIGRRVVVTASASVDCLQTESMADCDNNKGIAWVEVTAGGTGYTSQPAVGFTGGGGAGAAAEALVSHDGVIVGVRMTNHGTGYTSAPAVGFTGGGGSAAAATAVRGIPVGNRNELLIHVNAGPLTLKQASGVNGAVAINREFSLAANTVAQTLETVRVAAHFDTWRASGTRAPAGVTVANLPGTAPAGVTLYATNGRKAGEGGGAGTGVLVFGDGTNWIAVDSGAAVAA